LRQLSLRMHSPPCPHRLYLFLPIPPPQPSSTLFPYTTLFRSSLRCALGEPFPPPTRGRDVRRCLGSSALTNDERCPGRMHDEPRSEEHTSELQSRENLVCRLLLEKKKQKEKNNIGI